ncbi:MAG TPA: UDP-glucose 4-epimerase GalE [Gemmatimonadaceae bacterium]|nr:UDP-glucose 4-epimerase GalE [Gemmatimonadaceae bacterium]
MPRVLVTGAAGYIGSVATELLLSHGFDVLAVDDLSNGHRAAVADGAEFVQQDILDQAALTTLLKSRRCDAAFHFAAEAVIPVTVKDPGRAWRQNVEATRSLCDAMAAAGVGKLVMSSTCAVYGTPETVPISEMTPRAPINPYGASKLAAESMLTGFAERYGLQYVALRYFNVCGATRKYGEDRPVETHIIPIAADVALGRKPELTIYGNDYPTPDGTCVRDYVHVSDIAGAHLAALKKLGSLPLRAYNVGIGTGFSVLDVVRAVEKACGKQIKSAMGPRREGDPATLVADANAFARDAGFRPAITSLDQMVEDALMWRQAHPKGYK